MAKKPIQKKISFLPIIYFSVGALIIAGIVFNRPHYSKGNPPSPNPTATPVPIPVVTQWAKVPSVTAIFTSKLFLKRNKTLVEIPLKFTNNIQTAWLILPSMSSDLPSKWLIAHPQLTDLTWSHINEGTVYLYQKTYHYASIQDLLNNPPAKDKILIDDSIKTLPQYAKLAATDLIDTTPVNQYDYLLTTFNNSHRDGLIVYYINRLDATNGKVENNSLQWTVEVDTASDTNPYFIGGVHIDYQQY